MSKSARGKKNKQKLVTPKAGENLGNRGAEGSDSKASKK